MSALALLAGIGAPASTRHGVDIFVDALAQRFLSLSTLGAAPFVAALGLVVISATTGAVLALFGRLRRLSGILRIVILEVAALPALWLVAVGVLALCMGPAAVVVATAAMFQAAEPLIPAALVAAALIEAFTRPGTLAPTSPAPPALRRHVLVALGAGAAGLSAWAVLLLLWRGAIANEVERAPGETRTFVEEVFPAPLETVMASVRSAFNTVEELHRRLEARPYRDDNKYPPSHWLHGCTLYPLAHVPYVKPGGGDPALRRLVALPAERRRDDFKLMCFDHTWPSEYQSRRGQPLPFNATFIIHLESFSPRSTRVEVIELRPTVVAGQRLGYGHDSLLPSVIPDIQDVAPTTRDRVEVLSRVRQALPPT